MIPFGEALTRLLASARPLASERVGLDESAGRVLAEDVVAAAPMPAFDYSAMDGYAVATRDFAGAAPFRLPVVGESAAGGATAALTEGSVQRIFTGAPLPPGADAVVMQEEVEREGDVATFGAAPKPGAFVRARGADLAEGATPLTRGDRLHPGRVALAAALDRPMLLVAQRPVVTILCSGDELRSPGEPAFPSSIPESNGIFIAAVARAAGAIARVGPFVRDDPKVATEAIAAALRGSDLVVTVGGVSVGDHDVIRPALEAAGATLDFWRVAMKPGKPLVVGHAGATHVLGLPGNPASASLTFLLFGVPLLRALQGDREPVAPRHVATVRGSIKRKAGREEFLRARVAWSSGELIATLLPNQASGAVTSFAEAEALVVVSAEREEVRDGERLEAILIRDVV